VKKWNAIIAQESQTQGLIQLLGAETARAFNSKEVFRLAASK
jgi:hypothetical protein